VHRLGNGRRMQRVCTIYKNTERTLDTCRASVGHADGFTTSAVFRFRREVVKIVFCEGACVTREVGTLAPE
jgi:hypothetical protein